MMYEKNYNHLISMSLNFVDELLIFDGVGLPHLGQLSLHPR